MATEIITELYDSICNNDKICLADVLPFCNQILFGSEPFNSDFEKFSCFMKEILPKQTCGLAWTTKKLTIHCKDCQKSDCSCVCLKCFLEGNHKGHRSVTRYSENASCDCGDETLWKKEGFCHLHKGSSENPELEDIEADFRKTYLTLFAIVLHFFPIAVKTQPDLGAHFVDFLNQHQAFCDAVRRCLVIAFAKYCDIKEIMINIPNMNENCATILCNLLSNISNDSMFRTDVAPQFIKNLPCLAEQLMDITLSTPPTETPTQFAASKQFCKGIFHWIPTNSVDKLSKQTPWPELFIQILRMIINVAVKAVTKHQLGRSCLLTILSPFDDFLGHETDKTVWKPFIHQFADCLVDFEGLKPLFRQEGYKKDDPTKIALICHNLSFQFARFAFYTSKLKCFVPEVFDSYVEWVKKQPTLEHQSVLDPKTPISTAFGLHMLLYYMLSISGEPLTWLKYMAEKCSVSLEKMCSIISCLPLRLIAANRFLYNQLFVRNSTEDIIAIISFTFKANTVTKFIPLYSLVQLCAEFTPNKRSFLNDVATTYGVFTDVKDEQEIAYFAFLREVVSLSLDRKCFRDEPNEITRLTISGILKTGDKQFSEIDHEIPQFPLNNTYSDIIPQTLKELSNSYSKSGVTLFRGNDLTTWDMIIPWTKEALINDIIVSFSLKNKDIPFPIQVPDDHPQLLEILDAPIIRGIVSLLVSSNNLACAQIINSYLIICASRDPKMAGEKQSLSFESLTDLKDSMIIDFGTFIKSDIRIGGNTTNIVQKLEDSPLGQATLSKMGIVTNKSQSELDEIKKKKKERALAAKKRAMDTIHDSIHHFGENDESINEEAETSNVCSVCQDIGTEPLYYPVLIYSTVVPSLIDNCTPHCSRVFNICLHPAHKDCICRDNLFQCPIDRGSRNALLPIIQSDLITKPDLNSIANLHPFLMSFFVKPENHPNPSDAADSIGSMLTILEYRDRSDPSCLDSREFPVILRSLFVIFWALDAEEESTLGLSPISQLIYMLMRTKLPKTALSQFVQDIVPSLKDHQIIPFLRRAAIFEMSVLCDEKPQFFEWDDFLNENSLYNHYNIKDHQEISFKSTHIIKLPEFPVELFQPPFNEDVMDYDSETMMCLFDGALVTMSKRSSPLEFFVDYAIQKFKGAFVPFIRLTGKNAMSVIILIMDYGMFKSSDSLYTTSLGERIYGFGSSSVISLNAEKLNSFEKSLLTGSFLIQLV